MLLRLRLNPEKEFSNNLPYLNIGVLALTPTTIHEVNGKAKEDGTVPFSHYEVINHYVCLTNEGIRHILDVDLEFAIESGHYIIDGD